MAFQLIAALVIIGGSVFYLVYPIIKGEQALLVRGFEETTEAEARRRVALLALRDAEFDYHTGKIDAADYKTLKAGLAKEALSAIRSVEGVDDAELEREIELVRAGLRDGTACGSCGHLNPAGSKFCAGCGGALAVAEAASQA